MLHMKTDNPLHCSCLRILRSAAAAAVFLTATSMSAAAADPISSTGFFFDTVITISLYDTQDTALLESCDQLMQECEDRLSRTREGSDIWKINHAQGESVEVAPETAWLIERSLAYCELSDGSFDITIAPVIDLWDFHNENHPAAPSKELIQEALAHVDYHTVQVDGTTVTLSDPQAGIDLGAIAKGYISDLLKEHLLEQGCKSALINLGGNVMTIGEKPDGSEWRIGIRRPFGSSAYDLIAKVAVKDLSVITSGTYERYFIAEDGTMYHHILDPDTGYSVQNGLMSVSIISPDGTSGDALSTTCFVLGLEKGMQLIESLDDTEALFILEDETMIASSGWPSLS